jgi:hypothetical protein
MVSARSLWVASCVGRQLRPACLAAGRFFSEVPTGLHEQNQEQKRNGSSSKRVNLVQSHHDMVN